MAVTKSQLAQWSKEYEKKYPEKKNTEAAKTAANGTNTARPKAEHVTKAQLAQWSAEFDAGQAAKQEQEKNALSSKAFDEYRANNNLGFADEMDSRRDWAGGRALSAPRPADTGASRRSPEVGALLQRTPRSTLQTAPRWGAAAMDALSPEAKWGLPTQNVLEKTDSGAVAYGDSPAQKLKVSYAPYSQKDEFDRLNEWFDQPRNQELVGKLLEQKSGFTTYAEQGTSRNAASAGDGSIDPFRTAAGKSQSSAKYTDDDLRKQGYSAAEIAQARDYLTRYDAIPEWKKQARRAGNTIGGIADSAAGSAVMTGETAVQSAKNIADTQKNWAKVQQEIKGDERAERLFQLLTDVDMDYNPVYPESRNRDLVLMGYGSEEIREMRDRLAGLEVNDGIDPKTSVGYQLYKRGQELTGAAQSGLTEGSRAVQGAVSSAAENLAISSINPAAVLPVLSLQGAGDAMGQSIEKGESAGKTLAGGALKFGAGWGINSVGAADLAKTMGSDYAKDTLAGQIAAKIQSLVGDAPFAKAHPTVAAALSGGIDNAMQAFVESYADKAIDAALGDEKAAQSLFTTDTLIAALESGLSGGASGAMGGAVGSVLAKHNDGNASLLGQAEYYDQLDKYEKAVAAEKKRQQRVEEPGMASEQQTAQEAAKADSGLALSGASRQLPQSGSPWQDGGAVRNEQSSTAQKSEGSEAEGLKSDNPAVQQYAKVVQENALTGKTINLFAPEAGNEANRAAFEEAYGVQLPGTAAATRRALRQVAEQETAARNAANAEQNAANAAKPEAEQTVENAGETVDKPLSHASRDSSPNEGSPWQDGGAVLGEQGPTMQKSDGSATEEREYADVDRKVDPAGLDAADEGSGQMRETYGLREPSGQTARQSEVQRQLEQWGVESGKTKAAQDISQKLPANVDADRYAAAASTIYHLAQMDEVKSFDDALRLAGVMDNTALNVNYILDSGEGGRIALNTAYLYGADAKEQAGGYGGGLTDQSTSGQGRVYYEGTLDHDGTDMGSQIIELNAAATGTDAVLKNVLQNNPNVRAYVDSETARIFFGDSVSDIFGTVLHEDYHWYNSLDQAGAKSLQDHALTYLAQMDGYESVDEMIRDKMDVYASQKLTYEQAAEELVADAWRGIFATEADFKRWVEFQRGQAEKNAGVRGSIHKVMNRVKNLLSDIISRAKEVLTIDPSNAAALKAKRLAEAQRRTLQNEYFAHAEKAMDTLRAAKENAAALKTESAAEQQGVRYSLPDMAKETEAEKTERQMALTIHPAKTNAERTAKVSETDWSGQRIQDVKKGLRKILNEFGIIDKTYTINDPKVEFEYRTKTVNVGANHQAELTKSELNDFALVQANIEEVLKEAKPLEAHRNRKKNDHVEGMIVLASALQDGERIIPVKAELKIYDDGPTVLYIALAETSAKDSSEAAQKRRAGSKAERNAANNAPLLPTGSSKLTIADFYDLVKDYPNFTKYFSNEVAYKAEQVEELKQESRDLEKQRRELNAERAAWMDSAEVKELETKKKSLGLFSAEAKAFKAGEEYQAYLANRKKFNHRGEELTARISEVDDALREANDRLEARKREIRNDQQINYNWLAEKAGGAAEYHRQLAKEKFGTTDAFEKAGYILPDGQMLNFAQYESTRDTDHREIMDVFGPTDVKEGTDALNKFLAEGNIRVMAEQPGIDLSASVEPTAQQLEQIREMAKTLGAEKRQFTLDFSTKDGGIAATKDYSGHIDADKIVREIREYYKTGELPAESSLARFRYQLNEQAKQADRDAKRNRQRQASRTIADNSAAIKTLTEMMGLTRGVRVSDDSILGVAERLDDPELQRWA